jgi:hypothetical protein
MIEDNTIKTIAELKKELKVLLIKYPDCNEHTTPYEIKLLKQNIRQKINKIL